MTAMAFFFVPSVIFLSIVAPLWLILHYWSKHKSNRGLSDDDQRLMESLTHTIEGLEQRIDSLERILDDQHQGWRREKH
ncbi:envelope stress response membrane protein PspB [Aliamphritea hakodatensis]|uniref:envelope stress response membrane protein PspB n=1 Tax=Aliamphritea hakodatensis TaxID=2895352 RepID=UPI0022FD7ED5|nr:envelope stress response membrane protein PspB [Aliamphritea hakodatensis]